MTLLELIRLARPYRRQLLWGTAWQLAENLLALGVPWLAGQAVVQMLGQGNAVWNLLGWLLALLLAQSLFKYASARVLSRLTNAVAVDLKDKLQQQVLHLPMRFFDEGSRGDLLSLLTWEVEQLCGFISGTLVGIGPRLVTVVGAVAMMHVLDARLGWLVTIAVPVFYLLLKVLGRRLRPQAVQLQQAQARVFTQLEDNLQLMQNIKLFNREAHEAARYRWQLQQVAELENAQAATRSLLESVLEWLAAAAVLSLLVLAKLQEGVGAMAPAALVSFMLYAVMLTRPVSALAGVWGQVQTARGILQRLGRVLAQAVEPLGGATLEKVRGEVNFAAIVFAYPGRPPLLAGLDLHVRSGETVAITGTNGSGKTTLINLLLRLQQPDAGTITLDGHDIAGLDLHFLRQQISVVSQQLLLANDTVAANIGIGDPAADVAAIERAAVDAQADAFIRALPEGYATRIGDSGVRLSGGQRQRIVLARALLKRAPILVLDEATAMFDPEGEETLLRECRRLLANVTVILITHRPAALALADRVLQLSQGKLYETGAGDGPRLTLNRPNPAGSDGVSA